MFLTLCTDGRYYVTNSKILRCIHGKHSLINLFGEHCVELANLEYKVDLIGTSMQLKLLDKLEAEL